MLRTYRRAARASTNVGAHDEFPAAIQAKPAGNSSEIRRSTTFLARHAYVMPHDDPRTAQRVQNRPSEAPKSILGGSKIEPRSPKRVKERPKSVPGAPKSAQERPRSASRAAQERPKSAHERRKSAQERPKSHSRAPRDAPERPWGTILRLRSSKEAAFEGDPSRDSVEKRVRNDFRSVFASCAQTRTC